MSTPESTDTKWLNGFIGLCRELQHATDVQSRDSARGTLWLLLNSTISEYLRLHSTRLGRISREDVEDIAAEKSSDLLRKLELHVWDISYRSPAEVSAFLSRAARNGLVDRLREGSRQVSLARREQPDRDGEMVDPNAGGRMMTSLESPDNRVARREYAEALRHCADELDTRSRRVWFLRVLCDMPSKRIATHPQVALKVNHIDVLLHRARHIIRACMGRKGYDPGDMPPGTFAELWQVCDLSEVQESTGAVT